MAYPRLGQRLDGKRYFAAPAYVDEGRGVVEQGLELRPDGRFRLHYVVDTHRYPQPEAEASYARKLAGTYEIGRHGQLTLTDHARHVTKVATLAVVTTFRGRPRPGTKGIWLDLPVDPPTGRAFVDGNRLRSTQGGLGGAPPRG